MKNKEQIKKEKKLKLKRIHENRLRRQLFWRKKDAKKETRIFKSKIGLVLPDGSGKEKTYSARSLKRLFRGFGVSWKHLIATGV